MHVHAHLMCKPIENFHCSRFNTLKMFFFLPHSPNPFTTVAIPHPGPWEGFPSLLQRTEN